MAETLPPSPAAPAKAGRREDTVGVHVVGVLAICAQGLVIMAAILVSPDDDVSFPWVLAIGRAVLGVGFCFWLIARGRYLVALVPVASAVLVAGLTQLGGAVGTSFGSCSESELALAAEVAPPPGVVLDFDRPFVNECSAVLSTDLSASEVYAHFSAVFAGDGWTPWASSVLGGGVAGVKDGVAYEVAEAQSGFIVFVYDLPEGSAPELCTEGMLAAAAELAGPPGGPSVPLPPWGERGVGCVIRLGLGAGPSDEDEGAAATVTAEQVYDHYRAELEAAGWAITSSRAPSAISARRDALRIDIAITVEDRPGWVPGPDVSIVFSADEAAAE